MTSNVINKVPYLRTSREFPEEVKELAYHVNTSYVDIANAINNRTISLFPTTKPAITGENWYLQQNRKQQGFRQVYPFTTTSNIPHNIDIPNIDAFVRMYGCYTDGTNWYGLLATTTTGIAGQWSFYLSNTDIVFVNGGGTPTVTKGTIVLEWLSLP